MAESEDELKNLMQVKEDSEKFGLKLNIQKMNIMASGPITSWQIDGEKLETVRDFIFGGSKITADGDCSHEIKRCLCLRRKSMTNLCIKKQKHHFAGKGPYSQSYGFSSNHVLLWKLDHKEGWAPKDPCFWVVVLEKTHECPLHSKDISPKENQPWIFTGRTDAEAEASIIWPPDVKSQLFGKDPDAWKIEGKRRKRQQRVKWLESITDSMDVNLSQRREIMKDREARLVAVHRVTKIGHDWAPEQQQQWIISRLNRLNKNTMRLKNRVYCL